jgi:CRP-like cAMP-binding protein
MKKISEEEENNIEHKNTKIKVRNAIKKNISEDYIITILQKGENKTKNEIRILSEYLSSNFEYFKKIKENSENQKLEKIISVLNYETYKKKDIIISYGEEGDKFYILLEGIVNLYKPIYPVKKLTLQEYIMYLNEVKNNDKTGTKLKRIIEKNKYLNIDLNFYLSIPISDIVHYGHFNIYIEDYEKLGEFKNGFSFGEIALIKKTKRNATIIAKEDCKLVSINKNDYNKIIKELELKRLEKDLKIFKGNYPSFSHWNLNNLMRLFHLFSKEQLYSFDYLFKQNEESDYIYFIEKGNFEIFCFLSLGWIEEYYNYIIYNKSNIINYCIGKFTIEEKEINNLFDLAFEKKIKSPMIFNPFKEENPIISKPKKLNFLDFENQQIKNFEKDNLFKIKINNICNPYFIGFLDSLELKNRFFFAKCISEKAEVLKVGIKDFHQLICYIDEDNKKYFLEFIKKNKEILLNKIKNEIDIKLNKINNEFNKTFIDFLKAKGKFSYDKLEEKKKSRFVVKEINYKKNKELNSERLLKVNLKIKYNNSQNNVKYLNKTHLSNLTYSNFRHLNIKENKSNEKKKLIFPINLKTIENNNLLKKTIFKENNDNNSNSNLFSDYKNSRNKKERNSVLTQTNFIKIFDSEQYKKNLGKNDKFLTNEVIKLTGINKIIPKNLNRKKSEEIIHFIKNKFISPQPSKRNRNVIFNTIDNLTNFSSTNFTHLKSHSNSIKKNKIFINDRIRAEIRMKDFRSLRLKKKFY